MAEEFLKKIYQDASLLYGMREIAEYARVHDRHHANRKYNGLLPQMIDVCKRYSACDRAGGEALANHITHIKETNHDLILMGDIIEHDIIPLLERYMQYYGNIRTKNEEGDFLFESAVSGFLTIKDLKQNRYMHSTVCPMWEAKKTAEYLFNPRKKVYCVLGCGLGYLIYQLYLVSCGMAYIRIFESDARMIQYARSYGVLDMVPAEQLEIIIAEDPRGFLYSALEADTEHCILPMYLAKWGADAEPVLRELYTNRSTYYKFKRSNEINYWSNLQSGCKWIWEFDSVKLKKEFVIAAAGPSLDDSMEFLRKNQGIRTVIAVGTVFKKLLAADITPDMVVILDAQERTYRQIEGVEGQTVPMILGITAYWKFAAAYKGEKYLVPLKGLEDLDNVPQEYKEVWEGGGTVTSLAIETAVRFGAEKIFLAGVDLAYPNGMSHATCCMDTSKVEPEGLLQTEGCNGGTVYTTVVFNSYRHDIEDTIVNTPWIGWYNLSSIGAKIAGAKVVEKEETEEQPLVSVVIPTYNRIRTLPTSVNSVLNQTWKNLELIIMDDGSDDGTEAYVKGIADNRVRYRRSSTNMGPSAARNMGAELARGKYLAFQDSDDEWMPDKLEKQMKVMLGDEAVSLVYSEFGFYRGGELTIVIPLKKTPYEQKHGDLFSYLLLYPLISTQTILVETEEFIKSGGFDETLKAYEDFEFSLRFAKNHRIGFVEEELVRVNHTPGSVNQRLGERIRVQFEMVRRQLLPLRERKLLETKLEIILHEAESCLCHDVFIEELQSLAEELLTEEEKESAAALFAAIERSREAACIKMEMKESIPKLKQTVLQIYADLCDNKLRWTVEVQKLLQELAGGIVSLEKAFGAPAEVRERREAIQKSLSAETLSETDGLYLLADIVELFETLEKL